ncbi:hypothetical protein BH09ACT5_BH09ACT5_18960 [soil metagenome]
MRASRAGAAAAVAIAVALGLSGCFGPGEDELIALASADFDTLVDQASGVDTEVLRTLEVEEPAVEACDDTDAEDEHTVFVAAGTMAVQTDGADGRALVEAFELSGKDDDGEPRWTEVEEGTSGTQRAWADADGITASVIVEDGLLVVAVFSPCR